MEKRNALLGEIHYRQATARLKPTEPEKKSNIHTFTIVSDDNGGMRYDWYSGETYIEELSIKGASFEKLKTFFKNHNRDVDSAVGRIEETRVDGGTIVSDVWFGSGEDEQNMYRKYDEDILTDVSIGYQINKYEVEERDGEPDIVTITDYDIFELSAVGVGFDQGATKREVILEDESEVLARVEKLEARFGITYKDEK